MLVRGDLPAAQQIVQAAHAAHESGIHLADPEASISSLVVCTLPDEEALLLAQSRIEHAGIRTVMFREPDRDNETTAIATEALEASRRKVLARYPLWR